MCIRDSPRVAQRKTADNAAAVATADGATGIGEERGCGPLRMVHPSRRATPLPPSGFVAARLLGRGPWLGGDEPPAGRPPRLPALLLRMRVAAPWVHLDQFLSHLVLGNVKHARLCNIYEGSGLTHREPSLDDKDFDRFVRSFAPLMHNERDVFGVLGGRTDSNRGKIKRILCKHSLSMQVFHLCYNTRPMLRYGHF